MDFEKALYSFFGINSSEIPETIIITNISPIYFSLLEVSKIYWKKNGFYSVALLDIKKTTNVLVVKVLPGNNIIDVLKLLTIYCKKVFFFGIAGSLNPAYEIGDIVNPKFFIHNLNQLTNNSQEVVSIFQTTGLIQEDSFYYLLQKKGISLVDMECNDVYEICQERNIELSYWVQISDTPISVPFYDNKNNKIDITLFLVKAGLYNE